MKEEWRKQLQQKMADYEESDIDLSWAEIEQALEANRQKAAGAKRQKAMMASLWSRRVAAAAVVLLLAGVGYWALQRQAPEAVVTETASLVANEAVRPSVDVKDLPAPSSAQSVRATPQVSLISAHKVTAVPLLAGAANEEPLPTSEAKELSTEETSDEPEDGTLTQKGDKAPSLHSTNPTVIYPSDIRKKASSGNRLTAKVYVSNATTGYSSMLSSTQRILIPKGNGTPVVNPPAESDGKIYEWTEEATGDTNHQTPNGDDTDKNNDEEGSTDQQTGHTRQGETEQYRTQQTDETTHHHQPVRLGLSLRYRLNERWSIESGLTYTRLSSDFTKTVDGQSTTTEQHLNYIGIPVSVSYRLWGSRYLNVYMLAGGMMEKMVKGSQQTAAMTTSVSIHPLQFSLNSAIGAEFNISRQFSLYAEPGLGYWFDNDSSVSTYYHDKPLSFSLNLGIRVTPW